MTVVSIGELASMLVRNQRLELDFIARALCVSKARVLEALSKLDGIELREGEVIVKDKLSLALSAITSGANPTLVSALLDWRDFEREARKVLEYNGFKVYSNVRLKYPRALEIDVIGVAQGIMLFIDCKHWNPKYTFRSRLEKVSYEHKRRMEDACKNTLIKGIAFRNSNRGLTRAYGALVTLSSKIKGIINGVAIVPIMFLNSFIKELPTLEEDLYHIDLVFEK